ncbi:unnamed protein product [Rhizophagus irregularis]|nr:unnamed protein product [Rhizophagus irregularis]
MDVSDIDSEEEISDDQTNASEAVLAGVSISTAPIRDSNSSGDSSKIGPVNLPKSQASIPSVTSRTPIPKTNPNKMECLYQYAVEHGLDPEKFSIVTEAEKHRWDVKCFRGDLERDILIYRSSIEKNEDRRKYHTLLTDRERMIGEELLRRDILKHRSSTAWLDDLMKEWEKIHTQFIQVFGQASSGDSSSQTDTSEVRANSLVSAEVSESTAPIPSTHVSAKRLNSNSSDDSKEVSPRNSLEDEDDYYKVLLEDCAKDCVYFDSAPQSVKEEMPDDSDDDGYGGYNEYGECGRGYYYHDGGYERKTSPMMSPIISPATA